MSKSTIEQETTDITIELSKPIIVFGEKKTELTLKEPTGKEFREIGMVLSIDANEKIHFDSVRVIKMAEKLAGIPAGSLDSLPYKELTKIAYSMVPFFV